MNNAAARFLKLVTYDTQSDYESETYPSTPTQLTFAKMLAEDCRAIGLADVKVDNYGYVTATLPTNVQHKTPVIGFIAHMDTSSEASGAQITPRVVAAYDGGDIPLSEQRTLSPAEFPHLRQYIGQDLIVADGNTLLGADDKAGIAEILAAMEYLIAHPEKPHGTIRIAFTPDEEVGRGVDYFDVAGFGADFAYTVDGGELGELEAETFNAARAIFTINGKSVHPGSAYKVMRNAALIAAEIVKIFPTDETPATTRNHEGFYHLIEITGEVSEAKCAFLIREFDRDIFEKRKAFVKAVAERINQQYGSGTVALQIKEEYSNMLEILKNHKPILTLAEKAMRQAGITPLPRPVRGGTDGARLSFMGLPCPNIFAGGHNFHGPFEYIPIPSMEAATRVIVNICEMATSGMPEGN